MPAPAAVKDAEGAWTTVAAAAAAVAHLVAGKTASTVRAVRVRQEMQEVHRCRYT